MDVEGTNKTQVKSIKAVQTQLRKVINRSSNYLHVKTNAMRTTHLKEHAVMNHTQVAVKEPGAQNGVTVRIRRGLKTIKYTKITELNNF